MNRVSDTLLRYRIRRARSGATQHRWESLGPANIAGRLSALAVEPGRPERILAGAAGGGVWKSSDAGVTWTACWSSQATLNIGSLLFDPREGHEKTVYCGTGEGNLARHSFGGAGVYVSQDAGDTWRPLFDAVENPRVPRRIGSLTVIGSVLLAGAVSDSPVHPAGLFRFGLADGSVTTVPEFGDAFCNSLVPADGGVCYATIDAKGSSSGVWRSDDGGESWRRLNNGLPPGEQFGRASLALCAAAPEVLWLLAGKPNGRMLGVFRSVDGGESWNPVAGDHFDGERQLNYNNCVTADPADPDIAYCGALSIHRTADGGASWRRIADPADEAIGRPEYVHTDVHAILTPKPGWIYAATDGGLFVTEDGGESWEGRNRGLVTTMFHNIAVARADGEYYGGGMQDNGSCARIPLASPFERDFAAAGGGDGGWMLYDPDDAARMITTAQHMYMLRLTDRWTEITPEAIPLAERNGVLYAPIARDGAVLYTGTARLWKLEDSVWALASGEFDGSTITAIHVADGVLYIGTAAGGVFRDGEAIGPEAGPIARIDSAGGRVFIGTAGGRVFASDGAGWIDADPERRIPPARLHAIACESEAPYRVFAASEAGVFAGSGRRWDDITGDLPNAPVTDVVYHRKTRSLYVATYGRGLYRLPLALAAILP